MRRKGFVQLGVVGSALFFAAGLAVAQTAPAARVARLTFTDGYVHIDRADNVKDNTAGDPAQLNMPLIEGQTIVTGDNGQAEVEFEDGSVSRLTPNSSLGLTHLTADGGGGFNTQLTLARGLGYFELRAAPRIGYTISAGADRITPVENTTFRIALDQPPATVAVFSGSAHVEGGGSYGLEVRAGETYREDTATPGRYLLTKEIEPDSWDQWNESREQMAADAASQNTEARDGFAGNEGYGWSDLDANGRWYDVAGQGRVWQPNGGDTAEFDPYGNGSWVWYPGAGYVWASSYSWGWTPFRCGGWSYWDTFGWGWAPNAGCGSFGFAGYGLGFGGYGGYYGGYGARSGNRGPLNIILPPLRYTGHRPPTPGRGDIHPIIAVHDALSGIRPATAASGLRTIAGVVARPLNPEGRSYTARGGSAVGSSLLRDYPVDRATHTAVLGVQPGQGAARQGFVSGAQQGYAPSRALVPAQIGPGQMVPNGQRPMPSGSRPGSYPTTGNAYSHTTGQGGTRAMQMSAPHASAPSAPAPHMSAPSAPAASHASAPSGGGGKK